MSDTQPKDQETDGGSIGGRTLVLVMVGLALLVVIAGALLIDPGSDDDTPEPTATAEAAATIEATPETTAEATESVTGDNTVDPQLEGDPRYAAPDFPAGLDWINVDAPLTMAALRGKVVILDFWTYGCISCIHMIPVLAQLEARYPDELVVIGVHSAKFANEGETGNLRQIVQRYDLHHPVINDNQFRVWQAYGTNAWPTFAVINPIGRVVAIQSGEIPFDAFDRLVADLVAYFDAQGELSREPVPVALEGDGIPATGLSYPGKVLADVPGNRLFIADSSNHRIIVADLTTYQVIYVIGSGLRGLEDGTLEGSAFDTPQGMALRDETLYVADTNNHAIRAVDLTGGMVTTLAGTGQMGRGLPGTVVVDDPLAFPLRSPWDVEFGAGDDLYIAMAGLHQIWRFDLSANTLQPAVGDGREAALNRTLSTSQLAQPSGLYYVDGLLYFADSESSTVRVADIEGDSVRLVSGTDANDLFDFGDVDGPLGTSRLQHALGVAGSPDGTVYIADTYNSRIKAVDADGVTTTLFGLETDGFADGDADVAQFDEPGGLDYADLPDGRRVLFVADTNNNAVRIIDLDAGAVNTLAFPNPEVLQISQQLTVVGGNQALGETLTLPEQTVAAGAGELVLRIDLPDGFKINEDAPSLAQWTPDGTTVTLDAASQTVPIEATELRLPLTFASGEATLSGTVTLYYCTEVNVSLCFIEEFAVSVPVRVTADAGTSEIVIARAITPPVPANS